MVRLRALIRLLSKTVLAHECMSGIQRHRTHGLSAVAVIPHWRSITVLSIQHRVRLVALIRESLSLQKSILLIIAI